MCRLATNEATDDGRPLLAVSDVALAPKVLATHLGKPSAGGEALLPGIMNEKGSDRSSQAENWSYRPHFSMRVFLFCRPIICFEKAQNNIKKMWYTLIYVDVF